MESSIVVRAQGSNIILAKLKILGDEVIKYEFYVKTSEFMNKMA